MIGLWRILEYSMYGRIRALFDAVKRGFHGAKEGSVWDRAPRSPRNGAERGSEMAEEVPSAIRGVTILLSGLSGTIVEWGYVPLGLVVSRPPTYVWVWRMYPRTGGVITRLRFSGLGMIEEVRNAKVEKPPQSMSFFDLSLAEVKKLRYRPRDGWDTVRVIYDNLV